MSCHSPNAAQALSFPQALLGSSNRRFNISSQQVKDNQADIPMPRVDPLANAWDKGEIRQFVISELADSALHKH